MQPLEFPLFHAGITGTARRRVAPHTFLALKGAGPIIDVRAPAEFQKGHIPGAINLPLFNDDERAQVGTAYRHQGREKAIELGFKIISPKLESLFLQTTRLAADGALRIHCWRGGMRSESVAWLPERQGIKVYLLEGGYKAYRNYVLDSFQNRMPLVILSGYTGSGKTQTLHALAELGEQILDLEALAHHKGSAYGALGETQQPSTEMFENNLQAELRKLSPRRRIWVEDESRSIGRISIPGALHAQMRAQPTIRMEIPQEDRIARLVEVYTHHPPEEIIASTQKLNRRMGGDRVKRAVELIQAGKLREAVEIVLQYYDKLYLHALKSNHSEFSTLSLPDGNPTRAAEALIQQADAMGL